MLNQDQLATPKLDPRGRALLFQALMLTLQGQEVTVFASYSKQTETAPRVANVDYIPLPGTTPNAQSGVLTIKAYVDNAVNRRKRRVGQPYILLASETRRQRDPDERHITDPLFMPKAPRLGYTAMRLEGLTGFEILRVAAAPLRSETLQWV